MQETEIEATMVAKGVTNDAVKAFVKRWTAHLDPAAVEVVSAEDDARLLQEALAAGEIFEVAGGRYFARSYSKDTARSEERTFVATSKPEDKGAYNNWADSAELKPRVEALMAGGSRGKTMYVLPYLMAPPGGPLDQWAAGVELTDSRVVALHMIRMARVGVEFLNRLPDQANFVRGVHVTGDLDNLEQGTPNDKRYFATVADERLLLHYGSSYGGNALLGKIAHGLRQASYDGYASDSFLAEQFMLIGIRDKQTGRVYHICGGFPSASGKTNLAMMHPPASLADRYEVYFFGDDIAWIYVNPSDGRLYAFNPEFGVFGVAKDTNEGTNPNAVYASGEGSRALFTNVAYNPNTKEVWWEGRTSEPPEDVSGWLDWRGDAISDRPADRRRSGADGDEWAHPNSRFTTTLANVPNLSPEANEGAGVPIDAIIFGGRVREREPLIRAIRGNAEGVYDGLTLGAEATFAAEGKQGVLRYDPMSMRPFLSYSEAAYAQHWLNVLGRASQKPIFAHVNWFQRDAGGRYIWPGYSENLRALLWLMDLAEGRAQGELSPVGILPRQDELNLQGLDIADSDLERVLSINQELWQQEMINREEHLSQFTGLPEEIWQAHRDMKAAFSRV
ncbi:MAG TPA: phosphoenolpyruvate carboxykinase (GTP) [Dehalococcoidia bacterium]|nr:phosphoenolpyruvate carboxykinase (GTP) [Dehalococcoidia bacterium]